MAVNSVLTNSGIEMMNQVLSGSTMEITSVKAGSGSVDVTDIRNQTAMQNPIQTLTVSGKTSDDEKTTIIAQLLSTGLSTGYDLQQIGVFAKLSDSDTEVLFAILQYDTAIPVPSETEQASYAITFYLEFSISNSDSVSITIDSTALVTNATLFEYAGATQDDIDEICVLEEE